MASRRPTKQEYLQDIVNDYIAAGEPWPADRRTLAAWAVRNGRWESPPRSRIDQCAKELAEAMRAEMETDPQGRTVRAKHCAKIQEMEDGKPVQRTLWFGRDAAPNLMHIALQQRRKGILGDNRQLKIDQDSYNDNNKYGAQIQLSFDYTADLLEMEHASEYDPELPPDDDYDEGEDKA
jgi:hypothetical protein